MTPDNSADKVSGNGQPPPGPSAADMVKGKFLDELRVGSGLNDETILGNRLYTTADEGQIDAILDYHGSHAFKATLVIPFFGLDGRPIAIEDHEICFSRLKPTNPRPLKSGAPKYESPRGCSNHLYIPFRPRALLGDLKIPLWIV